MDISASANPSVQGPTPVDPTRLKASKSKKVLWPFFVGGVIVILLGVVSAYLLVNRIRSQSASEDTESIESELSEYRNPNGFAFDYPKTLQLVPTEDGVRLAGETEINFLVKPMEEPLEQTVTEVADNFGIDKTTHHFSNQTVNSRTGFLLLYEGKEYHYFPLFGNYYLEIVMDELNQTGMGVIDTLEFTPPQAQLR